MSKNCKFICLLLVFFFCLYINVVSAEEEKKVYWDEVIGSVNEDNANKFGISIAQYLVDMGVNATDVEYIIGIEFNDVARTNEVITDFEEVYDISRNKDNSVIAGIKNDVLYIQYEGTLFLNESSRSLFHTNGYYFKYLEYIHGLEYVDTSDVVDMSCMFGELNNITSLDLSNFNTSNVINMSYMFNRMESLTSLNLSSFNTSKVTDMSAMFNGLNSLASINLSNFDTSKVTDMSAMFSGMSSLTSLDLGNFNTSSVTNMGGMFSETKKLANLNISSFNTSNVTIMYSMFYGMSSITSLDLSNFNTSNVTNLYGMFSGMSALTSLDLSNFDTSKVTDMSYMFSGMSALTSLDLSSFDTSKVTDMTMMFNDVSSLTSLDLSKFNTIRVTGMHSMFNGMKSITSLNLSGFNTSKVTSMYRMFMNVSSLTSLDLSSFNTIRVTGMSYMFDGMESLTNLDLSNFNTSKVTSMSYMFDRMSSLTTLDLSSFDMSELYGDSYIFTIYGCKKLINIKTPITLKDGMNFALPYNMYDSDGIAYSYVTSSSGLGKDLYLKKPSISNIVATSGNIEVGDKIEISFDIDLSISSISQWVLESTDHEIRITSDAIDNVVSDGKYYTSFRARSDYLDKTIDYYVNLCYDSNKNSCTGLTKITSFTVFNDPTLPIIKNITAPSGDVVVGNEVNISFDIIDDSDMQIIRENSGFILKSTDNTIGTSSDIADKITADGKFSTSINLNEDMIGKTIEYFVVLCDDIAAQHCTKEINVASFNLIADTFAPVINEKTVARYNVTPGSSVMAYFNYYDDSDIDYSTSYCGLRNSSNTKGWTDDVMSNVIGDDIYRQWIEVTDEDLNDSYEYYVNLCDVYGNCTGEVTIGSYTVVEDLFDPVHPDADTVEPFFDTITVQINGSDGNPIVYSGFQEGITVPVGEQININFHISEESDIGYNGSYRGLRSLDGTVIWANNIENKLTNAHFWDIVYYGNYGADYEDSFVVGPDLEGKTVEYFVNICDWDGFCTGETTITKFSVGEYTFIDREVYADYEKELSYEHSFIELSPLSYHNEKTYRYDSSDSSILTVISNSNFDCYYRTGENNCSTDMLVKGVKTGNAKIYVYDEIGNLLGGLNVQVKSTPIVINNGEEGIYKFDATSFTSNFLFNSSENYYENYTLVSSDESIVEVSKAAPAGWWDESYGEIILNGKVRGKNVGDAVIYVYDEDNNLINSIDVNVLTPNVLIKGSNYSYNIILDKMESGEFTSSVLIGEELNDVLNDYRIVDSGISANVLEPSISRVEKYCAKSSCWIGRIYYNVTGENDGYTILKIYNNRGSIIKTQGFLVHTPVQNISYEDIRFALPTGVNFSLPLLNNVKTVPEDATNNKLLYSSSDENVLTVDENGVITTINTGTAIVEILSEESVLLNNPTGISVYVDVINAMTDFNIVGGDRSFDHKVIGESLSEIIETNVSPSNAIDYYVEWSSSNTDVIYVDGSKTNASIHSIKNGNSEITGCASVSLFNGVKYKWNNEPICDSINVEIHDSLFSIRFDHTQNLIGKLGDTYDLSSTLEAWIDDKWIDYGDESFPKNKNIRWESSDENIISISKDGIATAVNYGNADIIVYSDDDHVSYGKVMVVERIPITSVLIDGPKEQIAAVGSTYSLSATVNPVDTNSDKTITWSSSDTNIATVDQNGNVTLVGIGKAVIKATSVDGPYDSVTFDVHYNSVEEISIDQGNSSLTVGETIQFTATQNSFFGIDESEKPVSWSSSNPKVAAISDDGLVTAISVGATTIRATSVDGPYDECTVFVNHIEIENVVTSEHSIKLNVGATKTVIATINPSNTTMSTELTWLVENPEIAAVDNGVITGLKEGVTRVNVTTVNGKMDEIVVEVRSAIPVYRLYNPVSLEHLYTTDAHEVEVLYTQYGWGKEGIGWYSSSTGTPVYRLYNPILRNHLYTSDQNEINIITRDYGWIMDNDGKPLMYSDGDIPIFRLYNSEINGMHHLTTDENEYNVIPAWGWQQEGISMKAVKIGVPETTHYYK